MTTALHVNTNTLGRADGVIDGLGDGLIVGPTGPFDGAGVGYLVGRNEGKIVGRVDVGDNVGDADVGEYDGIDDG